MGIDTAMETRVIQNEMKPVVQGQDDLSFLVM